MRKFVWLTVLLFTILSLFSCALLPQRPKVEQGYYVIFSFQFKGEGVTPNVFPELRLTEKNSEYQVSITAKKLRELLKNNDKDGVYWWNVVYVDDPKNPANWVYYGGKGDMDPSVPILKDDLDKIKDTSLVTFYAKITDNKNTIVGFGDNVKDSRTFYFVGTVTGWEHKEMENKGNGVFEYTVTLEKGIKEFQYKIWPANKWEIDDNLKPLAFNGIHYYATGNNGIYEFNELKDDEYVKKFKVTFDVHHSEVKCEVLETEIIEQEGLIKVDGNLDDWTEEKLGNNGILLDDTEDKIGDDFVDYAGVAFDDKYVYVAAKMKRSRGDNNLLFILDSIDPDDNTKAEEITFWNRSYKVDDHDIIIGGAEWGYQINAASVSNNQTVYQDIKSETLGEINTSSEDGTTIIEIRIPKEKLISTNTTAIKFVAWITGGTPGEDGKQWASDFAPSRSDSGDTEWIGLDKPFEITKYAELKLK